LLPDPEAAAVSRTGAVGSVQEGQVSFSGGDLEHRWGPAHLERLADSYWDFLTRVSLRLLRIVHGPDSRTVVLLVPAFSLLRFGAPEYSTRPDFGEVTWPIRRGLLVAREGRDRGFLRITVRRQGTDPDSPGHELVGVRVEVRNYYPWLRGSGWFARFGTWLYKVMQLRIHAMIARGFLRTLDRWT
jgi:hypothetical protein